MKKGLILITNLIIVLVLISYSISVSCNGSLKFQNCSGTNTGSLCYYDYYLSAANTCTLRTLKVNNCISYFDSMMVGSVDSGVCKVCQSGFYAVTDLTETLTSKKYRCKTGDDGIRNCAYPGKFVFANGTTIRYCIGCMENYIGQNYSAVVGAPTSCTQNSAKTCSITNCQYCSQSSYNTTSCFACKSGFVLNSSMTACVSTVTDTNCWIADSAGTTCATCWWPYWFQTSVCSKSNVLFAVSLSIMSFVIQMLL